jgi:hypothetical protein
MLSHVVEDLHRRCRSALINGFFQSAPYLLDKRGYVDDASENLVDGVFLDDFGAELRQGGFSSSVMPMRSNILTT